VDPRNPLAIADGIVRPEQARMYLRHELHNERSTRVNVL
jgi:hypothetical protein